MMNKLRQFLWGRYGVDTLGYVLVFFSLGLNLIGTLFGIDWLILVSYLPLIWAFFRMLSRNIARRSAENTKFMRFFGPVKKWGKLQANRIRDIRTHRYIRCPSCRNMLRLPKGKGEITVTCPVCKNRFDSRT